MNITDLNSPGQHAYRELLKQLDHFAISMTPDAFTAFLELANQDISELLMDVLNGKSAKMRLFALRMASAPVAPKPAHAPVCGPCNAQ